VRLHVLCVGKIKEKSLREVADDYLSRIGRYTRVRELEVRDDAALLAKIPEGARVIDLQVWGQSMSSEQFAERLERWGSTGKGEIVFVIGGAEGIPRELSEKAHEHLSISTMTLPHRLARVVLLEQIYRGLSILRGEPYAREG
jgi:23S rRNA (pseudouridine1915-N3)-methyltransferase